MHNLQFERSHVILGMIRFNQVEGGGRDFLVNGSFSCQKECYYGNKNPICKGEAVNIECTTFMSSCFEP